MNHWLRDSNLEFDSQFTMNQARLDTLLQVRFQIAEHEPDCSRIT
jgi:hypothetical protein